MGWRSGGIFSQDFENKVYRIGLWFISFTAEAALDNDGRITSLRFYLDGKAYVLSPANLDDGQLRLVISEFETIESEIDKEGVRNA